MAEANEQFGFGTFGQNFGGPPPQMLPMGYYLNLLTSEYKSASKLQKWMKVVNRVYQDAAFLFASFESAFDLRYAVGAQLDILGQLIGMNRTVPFQPSGGVSPVLTDDIYRTVLLAKLAANSWNGNVDGLQPIWQTLFPGITIVMHDNQNMTATVFVIGPIQSIFSDLMTNGFIIPHAETVRYNYIFGGLPAFGSDLNNTFIAGADVGFAQ
jgi:hypothetical protein